jgi:hypothetical protein
VTLDGDDDAFNHGVLDEIAHRVLEAAPSRAAV